MSLVINHNLMAMTAARNLSDSYGRLARSTQRLSSGLRVNSAADDAAGLAIRELMRADIAVISQGVRNAGDAISMIQTAEGAMSVIDEKLIRMKELAEQAATGTYTTAQRAIMDSEYQAMAHEIDRIANATDFNGVKLLDGSLTGLHNGSGMKIHFGTGNSAAEDYYYIQMGDMRATEASGLRVGTSDFNDIFRSTTTSGLTASTPTTALTGTTGVFGIQYTTDNGTTWNTYGYVNVTSGTDTLTTVMDNINNGAAQTGSFTFGSSYVSNSLDGQTLTIGSNVFSFSSTLDVASSTFNASTGLGTVGTSNTTGSTIVNNLIVLVNRHINDIHVYAGGNQPSAAGGTSVMYLTDATLGSTASVALATTATSVSASGSNLTGGGGTQLTASLYHNLTSENYQLQLTDNSKGNNYQMRIVTAQGTIFAGGSGQTAQRLLTAADGTAHIAEFSGSNDATDWSATQNASGDTNWSGKDILTQSSAQLALAQLDRAINAKDTARANLGAVQNRLQNTITNLQIQAENLQAAESRISDVDVATEMTQFTRNNIMAQAGVAMLAQANSLPQLALQLLQGQ
ncbi:MAG: flagellin [Desulfarculus sp.]|nr:flagellin [Desulfarculus sp.]